MNRFSNDWNGLRWAIASLAAAVCAFAGRAQAQCNYEVTAIIQAPPCPIVGPPVTRGHGMNSLGHVCGSYAQCWVTADEAFYWTPETGFHMIPRLPGMLSSYATGINDHGIVCGYMTTGIDVGDRAWVYDTKTGEMMFLEPLHGVGNSYANAINNSNVVVGSRSIGTTGANPFNAVIWKPFEKGAPVQDLGVLKGPNSSAWNGNTKPADAAGWYGSGFSSLNARAILWADGVPIELGILPGSVQSHARYVNTHREVLGASSTGILGPSYAFIWHNGQLSQFLPPPGYDRASANGINDARQITGRIRAEATQVWHPYIKQHGKFHLLSDLISALPTGVIITSIVKPVDNGRLVCSATLNGKVVVVVLAPINQPLTDLNHDCATNTHDLLILLGQWGPTPTNATGGAPIADFNQDGRVDVLDLLILLGNWG